MTKKEAMTTIGEVVEEKAISRFGEAFQQAFDGVPMRRFREVVNNDINIIDYAERYGRNGKMFIVKGAALDVEQEFTFVVYNQNIQRKITSAKNKNQLPLIGKIIDNNGYFDIV